jgi:hypothetical protein
VATVDDKTRRATVTGARNAIHRALRD